MFKLTVEPENKERLSEKEYKKYLAALETLRNFEQHKDYLKELPEVSMANQQVKSYVKDFREDLRTANMIYSIIYKPKSKSWLKMIGEVKHTFTKNMFTSPSIVKNTRHEFQHQSLLSPQKPKAEELKALIRDIRTKVQTKKTQIRQLRTRTKNVTVQGGRTAASYTICGAAIHKPSAKPTVSKGVSPKAYKDKSMGVFMRILKSKEKQLVFDNKIPKTEDSYIGIEIEFGCDLNSEDLAFALYEAGLQKYVCLKQDGSVRAEKGGQYPHELCILAKEKEIFTYIKKACEVLKSTNAQVNKTCGLHVHIDMRSRNVETAFNNLVCAQNILYAMNPYSRQTGTYCKRVDTKDFALAKTGTRYFGINATAYGKHKTIEIRIHSGTTDERKISNWVKLLMIIVNKKELTKKASSSLKEFVTKFEIDSDLGHYISERMNKFVGEENKQVEERGVA